MMKSSQPAGPATPWSGSHMETPIIYHQPQYGFPETHTVVLPLTVYMSVGNMNYGDASANTLILRGTSPYDPIVNTKITTTAGASVTSQGFAERPIKYGSGVNTYAGATEGFPRTWNNSEIPMYRGYYDQMYESYVVLGMHYRLTVRMAGGDNGADVAIATATEAYGASSARSRYGIIICTVAIVVAYYLLSKAH